MLVLLVLFSVSSLGARDTYEALREVQTNMNAISRWMNCVSFIQAKIKNSLTEDALMELRRYDDIEYACHPPIAWLSFMSET